MRSVSRLTVSPGRLLPRMVLAAVWGMMETEKDASSTGRYRQTDAVDGDGALFHDVLEQRRRGGNGVPHGVVVPPQGPDGAGAVDVAGDDVSAEAAAGGHGPLQIHRAPGSQSPQGGAIEGFMHDIGGKAVGQQARGSEAHAVDGHAVSDLQV